MPDVYTQFVDIASRLEKHYRDMQDMEFTIERGKLWMLQTRNGKPTARVEVAIAVQMVNEGLIDKETALKRVTTKQVDALLHPQFDPEALKKYRTCLPRASMPLPARAVGQIYFDADTVVEMKETENKDCIMVRQFTKPDDVHGMLSAKLHFNLRRRATSHAAVVARQFGVPCVVGASSLKIDLERKTVTAGDLVLHEGDWISVDGTTGKVYAGKVNVVVPDINKMTDLNTLLSWADESPPIWKFGRMRIIRGMRAAPGHSEPKESACAGRSICSLKPKLADRPADDSGEDIRRTDGGTE